jgi:hypothetical protein
MLNYWNIDIQNEIYQVSQVGDSAKFVFLTIISGVFILRTERTIPGEHYRFVNDIDQIFDKKVVKK